jgi:sugar phosphate isomerase/epimerase
VPELLATCWTSAGNVRPGRTAPESPIPFSERIRAVADAGYSGIGFELADLDLARATIGLPALRRMIVDAGLDRIEVEFLNDWWVDGDRRAESDRRRQRLLESAADLGAHHIKAGTGQPGDTREATVLEDAFLRLCSQASDHGTRIALEPGAGSGLDLIEDAIPLVTRVGHPAGGILLDPWHLYRSGIAYDAVVGILPSQFLIAVELSDAPAVRRGTYFDDTFDFRLPPGDGAFDVPAFVRAVASIGWDGPWGVEVMSDELRELPIDVALDRCAVGARRCLQ